MIFEKIRDIICEQTGKDSEDITMDTSFRKDLDADSLDLFQIISDIEDAFDVKIDDVEAIVKVSDAVKFVEENQ